ncbi:hypothetical protein OIE66_31235 [Nonomuraea sp. NBC_01738]|uniref:hypothetical protein n=1 Tax=Nonomuraea sp. NBC_01738 TaxID=2976003 RepID=UPI002E0D656C|nr:hypothetical protein OIE66_31235 [Nonomuraea sp. NBC_01738]
MTRERAGIGRITAAVVASAAMLPYLTIKLLWLTGSDIGVNDPSFLDAPVMVGMNAMTFGMDAIALLLALSFTTRWGMRLPAWLVLIPLWVGTGLLSLILVTVPLGLLIQGTSIFPEIGPLQQWLYLVVYGGFIGQGAGLIVAFFLYARDRWPFAPAGGPFAGGFPLLAARGALALGVPLLCAKVALTFTEDMGLVGGLQYLLKGLLIPAGAAGLLALVYGRRGWAWLGLGWLGSGVTFGWGLYSLIVTLTAGPLAGPPMPWPNLVELFATLTALVIAVVGASVLTARSGVGDLQAAQHPLEGVDREEDRQPAHGGHR